MAKNSEFEAFILFYCLWILLRDEMKKTNDFVWSTNLGNPFPHVAEGVDYEIKLVYKCWGGSGGIDGCFRILMIRWILRMFIFLERFRFPSQVLQLTSYTINHSSNFLPIGRVLKPNQTSLPIPNSPRIIKHARTLPPLCSYNSKSAVSINCSLWKTPWTNETRPPSPLFSNTPLKLSEIKYDFNPCIISRSLLLRIFRKEIWPCLLRGLVSSNYDLTAFELESSWGVLDGRKLAMVGGMGNFVHWGLFLGVSFWMSIECWLLFLFHLSSKYIPNNGYYSHFIILFTTHTGIDDGAHIY